jgi:hypothetical protein
MTKIEKWHDAKRKIEALEEFIESFDKMKKGIRIEKVDGTSSWSDIVKASIIYEMEHSVLAMAEQALSRAHEEAKQACLDAVAEARRRNND